VARLEAEKGHRHLIEAMPAILAGAPRAWLVIVGEGSQDDALRAQAAALPAPARDRIVFTGRRDDIAAVTADLDIAVLPSLREAQGISILEAMARLKPVVASAVGGVPEVLTDGVDGLLVPPESPSALADAILRLASDPGLRERLGMAGWATVRDRFSIDAQLKRIEALYEAELVRSGAAAPLGSARQRSGEEPASVAGWAPAERGTLEIPPV
jgi:glycosyltransferase involved in cell wall biosynthesis